MEKSFMPMNCLRKSGYFQANTLLIKTVETLPQRKEKALSTFPPQKTIVPLKVPSSFDQIPNFKII